MLYTLVLLVCLTDVPRPCDFREEILDGLASHPGVAFMQAQRSSHGGWRRIPATPCGSGAFSRAEAREIGGIHCQ